MTFSKVWMMSWPYVASKTSTADHYRRRCVEGQPEGKAQREAAEDYVDGEPPTVLTQFAIANGTFPVRPITALEIII